MSVLVLWEDKSNGPIKGFGPQAFLIACVASRLAVNRHSLARSEAIAAKPCAGNANVLRELRRGPLWDSVAHVVAVLDTDELHDRLPVASRRTIGDAEYERWSASVMTAVRSSAPPDCHARLEICLLDRNLETLVGVVGRGAREFGDALNKSRLHRDKLLQRAADDQDLLRRACAEMPSWDHLVTTVTRLVCATPRA